jgi:hypothetical protein
LSSDDSLKAIGTATPRPRQEPMEAEAGRQPVVVVAAAAAAAPDAVRAAGKAAPSTIDAGVRWRVVTNGKVWPSC